CPAAVSQDNGRELTLSRSSRWCGRIVVDHLFQRRYLAGMHVGRPASGTAQRGCLECALELGRVANHEPKLLASFVAGMAVTAQAVERIFENLPHRLGTSSIFGQAPHR